MNEDLERQYGYLWGALDKGWVLLRSTDLPGGYCVYNKSGSILLIESDEVNSAVCKRMKDAGCEVLEKIPTTEVTVSPVRTESR
jgi:hypothetical protein